MHQIKHHSVSSLGEVIESECWVHGYFGRWVKHFNLDVVLFQWKVYLWACLSWKKADKRVGKIYHLEKMFRISDSFILLKWNSKVTNNLVILCQKVHWVWHYITFVLSIWWHHTQFLLRAWNVAILHCYIPMSIP